MIGVNFQIKTLIFFVFQVQSKATVTTRLHSYKKSQNKTNKQKKNIKRGFSERVCKKLGKTLSKFFLFGFSFINTDESQGSSRRERTFLLLLCTTSNPSIDTHTLPEGLMHRAHLCTENPWFPSASR